MLDTLFRIASLGTGLAALVVIWLLYMEDRDARTRPHRRN